MPAITVNIPDHQFQKLQKLAATYNLSPEALLTANLESWLNQPNAFTDAAERVLNKNAELYKRLA
ncbi:MAG: DNA-binding protein [Cyanobacteria bacterium J06626_18]